MRKTALVRPTRVLQVCEGSSAQERDWYTGVKTMSPYWFSLSWTRSSLSRAVAMAVCLTMAAESDALRTELELRS
jgi:hypothetical protein